MMSKAIQQPLPATDWENRSVDKQEILQLLESAVWAPNDGLREPWRFIYVDGNRTKQALPEHPSAPAHLIVVACLGETPHKQTEDLCAVYGLIQNVRLLAWQRRISVRISIEPWMYASDVGARLGIGNRERIAAILDLGYATARESGAADSREIDLRIANF